MKSRRKVVLHPIRLQILQHLSSMGSATPGMLAELMPEVPRTTLYRHVNLLHQEGYLKVAKEVRIRGTYEREYELDKDRLENSSPKEKERQATFDLLLKMLSDFEEYYEKPESDSGRDMLFFTGNSLKLTDEEFSGFLEELFALIAKYDVLPRREGQKVRSITMISAPTGESRKRQEKKEQEETEASRPEAAKAGNQEAGEKAATGEPGDRVGHVTGEPGAGPERATGEPGDRAGYAAVKPGDRIGYATGEPGDRGGYATGEPGNRAEYVAGEPESAEAAGKTAASAAGSAEAQELFTKRTEAPHRSAFLEAIERLNGMKRKFTDPREGDRAIRMPADATYDMADKVQQIYIKRKVEYNGEDQ